MKRDIFMRLSLSLLVASASVAAVGCGAESSPIETGSDQPATVSTEDLRSQFETIAESGYVGSGLPGLQSGIEALNKPEVTKEFENLAAAEAAGQQDKVKASAKKLIRLL